MIAYIFNILLVIVILSITVEFVGLEVAFVSASAFILASLWRLESEINKK